MKDQHRQGRVLAPIPFSASEIEGSIRERFRRVVRAIPDHIAVDTMTDHLTYAQLDSFSDRIAQVITSHNGFTKDAPIALLIDQGHFAMAALLGVLKTGRGAVVFPPDSQSEHIQRLWVDALKPLVLTSRQNLEQTRGIVSSESDWLIIDDFATSASSSGAVTTDTHPEHLAVISYTSGSTGDPKGVLWSNRLMLHAAYQNQARYHLTPRDRIAVLASFGFGAAMTQCSASLLSGATLYLPNIRQTSISTLVDKMSENEISILAMPPFGLFRQIMDSMADGERLSQVRLVILGGDDLYKQDVEQFRNCFGTDTILAFRLAGSETMVIRELHILPGMEFSTEKIPVGYPVPDKEVILVNENGLEVTPGDVGEVLVRSPYLASGYWRQPALTEARFKPDPAGRGMMICWTGDLARINAAGQMEHFGRKDNMVKIRGFSVHLEAIDFALQKLAFIQDAITVVYPLPGGDKRLVAYLIPNGNQKPSVSEIRKELVRLLPEHMLPSVFVWMEELPRTSTGKVDRKVLPPPPRTRPDLETPLVLPHNNREEALALIWKDLLQLDEVGVEDNFFDLGGDSLLSVQMIISAERLSNAKIPPSFFKEPTISHLVEIQESGDRETGASRADGKQQTQPDHPVASKRAIKFHSTMRKLIKGKLPASNLIAAIQYGISSGVLNGYEWLYKGTILRETYTEGCKQISRYSRSPWVAQKLYRTQFDIFSRFLSELEDCTVNPDTAFPASLTGHFLTRLRSGTISEDLSINYLDRCRVSPHLFWSSLGRLIQEASLEELDKYFSVSGLEYLKQALLESHGVILLTYHSSSNRLAIAALPRRLTGDFIPTISQKIARQQSGYWAKNRGRDIPATEQAALFAETALNGQRLLEQGKIIQFVSDNEYGQDGYPVILAGRRYHLKPGFAELACNTGAKVIPQYTTVRLDGHIQTIIMPAFVPGSGSRESQVNALLDQYADFINRSWRIAPESLLWGKILKHFRQPAA